MIVRSRQVRDIASPMYDTILRASSPRWKEQVHAHMCTHVLVGGTALGFSTLTNLITWGPLVPPTPTSTAKLVRCVLEHCTVT